MRHSIQNKAFYIFDMAKKIYIKTRHAHMSRFDPETESQDLKEHIHLTSRRDISEQNVKGGISCGSNVKTVALV